MRNSAEMNAAPIDRTRVTMDSPLEDRENIVRTNSEEHDLLLASQNRSKSRTSYEYKKVWGERSFRDAIADSDRHSNRNTKDGSLRHSAPQKQQQQQQQQHMHKSSSVRSISTSASTQHHRNTAQGASPPSRPKAPLRERRQQREASRAVSEIVQECIAVLSMDPNNQQPTSSSYHQHHNLSQKEAEKVSNAMLKLGRELRQNSQLVWTLERVLCGKRGMVSQIVQAMQRYDKNARVQVSALCLLCRIIHANRWLAFVIFKAGAVYPTLHAMRQFQQQTEVQLNGCALLLKLLDDILSDENDKQHHLLKNEILPVIILVFNQQSFSHNLHPSTHIPSFLQKHPASSSSGNEAVNPIANAAKLLWRISATRQGRQYILNAGGAEAVCRAMIDVKVDMGVMNDDDEQREALDEEEHNGASSSNNKSHGGKKSSSSTAARKKKQKRDLMTLHLRLLQDHAQAEESCGRIDGSTPSF